ncbi:MAG: FG-GAP-like repeat-containing protein [Candidatus Paceibacterota bacterium]
MSSESNPSRAAARWAAVVVLIVATAGSFYYIRGGRLGLGRQLKEIKLNLEAGNVAAARERLLDLHAADSQNAEVVELLVDIEQRSGNVSAAIEWLKRIPDAPADRSARARQKAAQLAMQVGQARATESLALEAIRLDPGFVEPRQLLMRYYFVLFQRQKLYEQGAILDQRDELQLQELMMCCVAQRAAWDDDEHVRWLEQCMREDPENSLVRAALARYYANGDRHVAARRVLQDANATAPDAWWILLVRAEDLVGQGQFRVAFDILAQLPAAADSESRVWMARAAVWNALGHTASARVALENAGKLDPYDSAPTYGAARILMRQGESEQAERLFARSQQQTDLMRLMGRLMEAANPAYERIEPVEETLRSTVRLFNELGMSREARIVANELAARISDGADTTPPPLERDGSSLSFVSPGELVAVNQPKLSVSDPEAAGTDVTQRPELRLVDVSEQIGLTFRYDTGRSPYRWLMETLGGGVAVLDFDLDGWPDIYLTQGCALPVGQDRKANSNWLFRNLDGDQARDATELAGLVHGGYGQGCAVGDYDEDGFPDLLICNYGETVLFQNRGDGTFANANSESGITNSGWSTSATFSDVDHDGDLDLYVVRYLEAPFDSLTPCKFKGAYTSCRPFNYEAAQDVFWENLGNGQFAERTSEAGFIAAPGKGLGVLIGDFDRQGRESIFVANDTTANFFFERTSASTFQENGIVSGLAVNRDGAAEACMGVASGDVDGDGRFDLFVTNFQGETNTLYRSLGKGEFVDDTQRAGLADSSRNMLGFGCQFLDIDCNGWLDLFVANGHLHDIAQPAQLYYNQGGGRFREVSKDADRYFERPRMGRSVATLDWNRDRLPDLVVTYQVENVSLLLNQSTAGQRLSLRLIGSTSNRDAIGTQIRAHVGGRDSYFRVDRGGGYFAANDPQVIIGCGSAAEVDHLEVTWPSGEVASWQGVATGKAYVMIEGKGQLLLRRE